MLRVSQREKTIRVLPTIFARANYMEELCGAMVDAKTIAAGVAANGITATILVENSLSTRRKAKCMKRARERMVLTQRGGLRS